MSLVEQFKKKTVFSLEVFPPKSNSGSKKIISTLEALNGVSPDFISVTLGAGGSAQSQETVEVAKLIQNELHVPAVAHIPGLYRGTEDVDRLIEELLDNQINHVLALRGDPVAGLAPNGTFDHAVDLIAYIQDKYPQVEIASACYPEVHSESKSVVEDINALRAKVAAGSQHLISQLFFDNQHFYDFQERLALADIQVPVEAGIMPCTSKKQIERITAISGVPVPTKYRKMLDRYANNPAALKDAGIAYAIDQIIDLVAQGVDGIHLYTMNQPDVAERIWQATKSSFAANQKENLMVY
ncbi:methylenetetrahydrofolate reductase [NAD(P)H] [Fructobacillus ficulneus]|uniref:Methylenetetrahydrofolate reductase n=1 Tax=Fructobacillus ficulneus TaxID=157463 RepID=A0A0K8MHY4_9LACO|nr:methylenetetrahydrofolate reductase [NAD(P)H] [Fructobacillus ficulneus]GAO99803.1 methylenetetrahydrofolate reductase [Fructobacillus ficulneus]